MLCLHLHPSLQPRLTTPDWFTVEQIPAPGQPGDAVELPVKEYIDCFGNLCTRFDAPAGHLKLSGWNITQNDDYPELQGFGLEATPVGELPEDTLQFLLASRYCEVDKFGGIAQDLFGHMGSGWALASAIRDWVHDKVFFNYKQARSTKTAMDVYTERVGVCRDFQHLAITLTRCMNIPARLRHRTKSATSASSLLWRSATSAPGTRSGSAASGGTSTHATITPAWAAS